MRIRNEISCPYISLFLICVLLYILMFRIICQLENVAIFEKSSRLYRLLGGTKTGRLRPWNIEMAKGVGNVRVGR